MQVNVILSPATGPQVLERILCAGISEEDAWLVLQCHASESDLQTLAECIEELAKCSVYLGNPQQKSLLKGALGLIGENREMLWNGHYFQYSEKNQPFHLESFLHSLSSLGENLSLGILPGPMIPIRGLEGLKILQEKGARLLASAEDKELGNWVAGLEKSGIRFHRQALETMFTPPSPSQPTEPLRLLIADDDVSLRGLMGELARLKGFVCNFAVDGLDVLNLLKKQKYVGLVLDMHMPELDGMQALEWLKVEKITLPVLVVTGEADQDVLAQIKEYGAKTLPKPFSSNQFHRALEALTGSTRSGK